MYQFKVPPSTVVFAALAIRGRGIVSQAEPQHGGLWNQRRQAALAVARVWYRSRHMHEKRAVRLQHLHAVEIAAAEAAAT